VIFDALLKFKDETEYYVIMMAGWLLSECIIRYQEPTLKFLTTNTLNKKIQNKAIQKCRESNRLSSIEKDFLLQYKVK
jgi:3-methyladenine DNA glycosylase AlkD